MLFYADLHIHSKYSRATSKSCNLEELAIWAQKKGLSLISTGDFTHPAWFSEIQEKLIPDGCGAFRLKPEIEKRIFNNSTPVRFILSVEISTIYKKWDKTRKVHHCVFVPDMQAAHNFRDKLSAIGNIKSDGRPILGLDSRDLLEITLESGENSFIIPAHIWTPWFSVLGSKSGFDSIDDCYGDLAQHIFAAETGLSSDPEMNWRVSSLDRFRLVSNSDAHSPSKLAREATVFDTNPDYYSILNALKTGEGYVGTVEFFPEEGKYHEDGHRKCNVCLSPEETQKVNGICPVCGKPLTIGVLNRVNELADRKGNDFKPSTGGKVYSLVPLQEILSEISQVGPQSKKVIFEYENLIQKLGAELSILQDVPLDEIEKAHSSILSEAISRLRNGKVIKHAGYDGEYGVIRLFEENELVKKNITNLKLNLKISEYTKEEKKEKYSTSQKIINPIKNEKNEHKQAQLDEYQTEAVLNTNNQLLISAGPGSGKTTVLTRRIAHLIEQKTVEPQSCLAVTFTKKAANEMRSRLKKLIPDKADAIHIHTFHSLCFSILKEQFEKAGLPQNFKIVTKAEKELIKDTNLDNSLDFDDLILYTLNLFETHPDILEKYRLIYKNVSVDEYQDIDENQYKLIKLLVPVNGNICIIGDPNQSIYGFRGGDSKFFNNFSSDYPQTQIIKLKNNYRSTDTIVNASNQMLDSYNIISKYDKPHEKITIHKAPTDKAEAEYIVSTIENLIGGHSFFSLDSNRSLGDETDYSFGDFAVLYRTSAQLEQITEAFRRSGMPFAKYSNDLLCENKNIRDLLKQIKDNDSITAQVELLAEEFSDKIKNYILNFLIDLSKHCETKDQFIHEVSLLSETDTLDERADRISIMTLHSSKGLEFKCVFIAGLEEGILPLYRAKSAEDIEEERRLLYVGMTRAEQLLFFTHAVKRKWFGGYKNFEISPFLIKIKNDLLTLSKFQSKPQEKDNSQQLTLFS